MKKFESNVKNAIRAIEDLATVIADNPNVEEYIREACWNHSEEIHDALNDGDYKYAALMIIQDELFNR